MSRSWRIYAKKQWDEEGSEIWDKGRMGRRKEEWDVTECKIEAKDEVKEEAKEEMTMNRLHKMVTFGVSRFWLLHVPCGSWSFMIVPTKGLITSDLSSLVLIWELIVLYLSPWSKSFRIPPGTFFWSWSFMISPIRLFLFRICRPTDWILCSFWSITAGQRPWLEIVAQRRHSSHGV